jgi:hypothetical protein
MKQIFARWFETHPEIERRETWQRILLVVAMTLPMAISCVAWGFYVWYGGQ